ncbi:hypothetical protein [Methylobacterium sp. WSM2598]|uniref:hypothetical protein n=1 Tax=Methylobacterium sp. WSM2598 TaxID=398261 RepID=UPI0003A9F9DD|nr:hypothetical protein [Methylobacterium sp. WSM2598]
MAAALLLPAAEAAVFTLGCAVIHAQRQRAERLTVILVFGVFALLLLLAVAAAPEKGTLADVVAGVGDLLPLAGEPVD